ncbi:MAG: FHA domain-containing protein, partial [Ruminococcus sp.]|nr:FHA domain-containing protein [Ruminococcus sp.]
IVYVNDSKFNIHKQIAENNTSISSTETNESSGQFEPVEQNENHHIESSLPKTQQRYEGGTFIPPEQNEPQQPEEKSCDISEEIFDAYLIDPDGKKIYIDDNPFTIGRVKPKSLVIDEATVSGEHAKIKKEYNIYYLSSWHDRNGTFLNEDFNKRIISSVPLNDGDRIYFYRTCYTFHTVKKSEISSQHTVIIQQPPQKSVTNHTFVVSQSPETRTLAYIRNVSDNSTLKVMQYPFTDDSIYGVVFSMETVNNRTALFIENTACYSLKLENVDIFMGMKKEIFSGCSLFINSEKYTFIIEN